MRLKLKFVTGCVFLIGIGLGVMGAAYITWRVKFKSTVDSVTILSQSPATIEKAILDDDKLRTKVEKLGEIKEIRDILLDPEIMEALQNRDYVKLLKNDKFRRLMQHPAVKEISADFIKHQADGWLKKTPGSTAPETGQAPSPSHIP